MSSTFLLLGALAVSAVADTVRNDGIHLAIGPHCGTADGAPMDVNTGLADLKTFSTIVSFGDSYTAGGNADGGPLLRAVQNGDSPKFGGRYTNGPVWAENIANDTGALYMDYAISGAVTDATLWPSKGSNSDFVHQVQLFLSQNHTLDPSTTLYTVFFGINDITASRTDGAANAPRAAQVVLDQIALLLGPPTNAVSFLIADDYGRGSVVAAGETYKNAVFAGLHQMQLSRGADAFTYAFVDFKYLWSAVLGSDPGFAVFGYNSAGACTVSEFTVQGACADPAHRFYWISGHPGKQTHRIMADYIELALEQCVPTTRSCKHK
ncbi:carbohydrate esterase family 16 protein [Exidia glandulosa HHB12029]|uniref:Carbohydrate esterase family 16 protein n=1 Tax=Exidia glandulosa HHB12029 TaxID=1314781 RepID=A0A165K4D5_EXIGL|nr:carbohydrate esterase family 16 protein [Exidia glandulosa HHB12029]